MTDEYTAWKASQARPWAESVRKASARLAQREAALDGVADEECGDGEAGDESDDEERHADGDVGDP